MPESELVHMGDAKFVHIGEAKPARFAYAAASSATDMDPIIEWPPAITLVADSGNYLSWISRQRVGPGKKDWQNNCEAEKQQADRYCEFQVEVLPDDDDHLIALKGPNGKYLSRIHRGGVDFAEFEKDTIDDWSKFRYYSLGNNKVALKGDNDKFLARVERDEVQNIEVSHPEMDVFSQFTVGENLIKKEFSDIEYELDNATVTDEEALVTMSSVIHNSGEDPVVKTLAFKYTTSVVGTWNNEIGVSVGVETSFKTGIPCLAEGKVTLKVEGNYSHSFGGSEETTQEVEDSTQVVVPPKTRMKVQVIVKRAKIDVDFTYTIVRMLTNGEIHKGLLKKGVYRNVESYESVVDILDQAPFPG